MITAEIKLYDEPAPITLPATNNNLTNYAAKYSQMQVQSAIEDARALGVLVGTRFKYKLSGYVIRVIGYQNDEKKVYTICGAPGILLCERLDPNNVIIGHTPTCFSINEVFGTNMEIL